MDRRFSACLLACAVSSCVERGAVLGSAEPSAPSATRPTALAPRKVEALSASEVHSCAVSDGRAYCWGDNTDGQLGIASDVTRAGPTALPGSDWRQIVTGKAHTCALDASGDVYCWGANERGQLGQGHRDSQSAPVLVPLPAAAIQLASGFRHSCVILETSELWCWGDGNEGQIGRGDFYPGSAESREADAPTPEQVALPPGTGPEPWSFVDTGQGHTCALRSDGSLWCWGRNSQRQLGQPSEAAQIRAPVRVGTDLGWLSVDAAQNYTCALSAERSLWCWGFNMGWMSSSGNPLGVENVQLDVPTVVSDEHWAAFGTNMFHSCGLDDQAQLWCWGRNHEGQLAMENPIDPLHPGETIRVHPKTRVATGVAFAAVGTYSTCVVSQEGSVRCVGKNDRGQLGEGAGTDVSSFVEVPLPSQPASGE